MSLVSYFLSLQKKNHCTLVFPVGDYVNGSHHLSVLQERQKQLESLGISLQSSGIKVGDDKCFLVNLNADPALNELLVYYLKVIFLADIDTSVIPFLTRFRLFVFLLRQFFGIEDD